MDSNNRNHKVPQTEILRNCDGNNPDICPYEESIECMNVLPFDKGNENKDTVDIILNYLESCVYCDALLTLLSHYEYLILTLIYKLKHIHQTTNKNGYDFHHAITQTSSSDERPAHLPSWSLSRFRIFSASCCFYHP